MVAALLTDEPARPLLYITAHLEEADHARDDLELFAGRTPDVFSAWEALPGEGAASSEIAAERVRLCGALRDAATNGQAAPLLVAPIQALMQPVPSPGALEANSLTLAVGEEHEPHGLVTWLIDHGYERLDLVESPGDFALRGGILDVFPPGGIDPVRIEFFGDTIESIRQFDPSTQRSAHDLTRMRIAAVFVPQAGRETAAKAAEGETTSFLSYLPADTLVVLAEPVEVDEMARTFWRRLDEPLGLYPPEAVFKRLNDFTQVHLSRFGGAGDTDTVHFDVESVQRFETKAVEAVAELCTLAGDHDVYLFCYNEGERQRLDELVTQNVGAMPASLHRPLGLVHRGFCWRSARVVVVGHHEVFHRYEHRHRIRRAHASKPLETWLDLQPGDSVVHVVHGIARFTGMRTLTKAATNKTEEFLTLEFADHAMLHVPVTQIDLVQKYIGAAGAKPSLSKLGGKRWGQTKERVAEAVEDMAGELLRIQAQRASQQGTAYPQDTAWQREFEAAFVYTETEDQLTVAEEIRRDLTRARPMDRLICGDVGYGKTELAMRAAFKVIEYGRQVAVLVPTTVLAEQHEKTFRERMAEYPFTVASLSRFKTAAEQKATIKKTKKGHIDVLIGTHRLLSKDVGFADLGLVIIDEEQRFGVEHKERLKCLRETVDVLTMTATPIPRTLHMAMLGIRDISSLTTPPLDRRSIVTQVRTYDRQLIHDAIIRELNRDGQVYFVHNFVQSIQAVAAEIQSIVPEARIVVGHGQMKDGELERVMRKFVNHEADVLVSTTIIESGLDIPNVNTIFINRAERYGLADMHQLRGRVGRYKHRAYCYLLIEPDRPITPTAARRLKAVEEYSDLGAGFRIAMRDLEIRGAGNILGAEQSGHIAAVGYEMYCQLLDSAVKRMRGEAPAPRPDVHLELDVPARVPRRYVRSDRARIDIYRRITGSRTQEDIEQIAADLRDAYGPLPEVTETLLRLAELRVLAKAYTIRSIIVDRPDIIFRVDELARLEPLLADTRGSVRVPDGRTVHWRVPAAYFEPATLLTVLRKVLQPQSREPIVAVT